MIPQVAEDRDKCLMVFERNNPKGFARCRGCSNFVAVSVGGGTLMYYCSEHNVQGTAAG